MSTRRIENESFTAIAYNATDGTIEESATYDTAQEAIDFAKHNEWDAVENDLTGKTIWSRNDDEYYSIILRIDD